MTSTDATNPDAHGINTDRDGRARTWLKPEQVERLRNECLTGANDGTLHGCPACRPTREMMEGASATGDGRS